MPYPLAVDNHSFTRYVNDEESPRIFSDTVMTITLTLKPEVEAGLIAQAQAKGMTLEDYLLSMVEGAALSPQKTMSPAERAAAFEAWSANHPPTPALSDYAVSRDSMYEGRER